MEHNQNEKDHVETPAEVVKTIYNKIKIQECPGTLWMPFDTAESEFVRGAEKLGLPYAYSHISQGPQGDYFKAEPPKDDKGVLLISNPPFGSQNAILKRAFDLIDKGKISAFALILPLSTLETSRRAAIFSLRLDTLGVTIFPNRLKFKAHETSFNTAVCLVSYGVKHLKGLGYF